MTDTAKNPTSAGGGRYRPVLCEPGYSKGRHTWNVKANSAGRLEVGVSSSGFNVKGREGSALNNQSCGWCICVYEPGRNMTLWHAGRRVCYPSFKWQVGSILNVILDCDAHTLEFRLNGKAGSNTKFYNLPRNETFKLTAAFGGDNIRGASLSLVTGKPGKAVDDNIITPVVMTNSLKDIGSNNSILKLGEYSRDPSTVVVPGPLFGSVTELSNAMRNAKEWKARKISRVIIASGTHYVPDGGLRLIGHEFAGLEIRGEGIGKTVLKGGGGGNGKGTIYIENTSGIVHLVNLTLANCRQWNGLNVINGAKVRAESCEFRETTQAAILVWQKGYLELINCILRENYLNGLLAAAGNGHVNIYGANSRIYNNGGYGLNIQGSQVDVYVPKKPLLASNKMGSGAAEARWMPIQKRSNT